MGRRVGGWMHVFHNSERQTMVKAHTGEVEWSVTDTSYIYQAIPGCVWWSACSNTTHECYNFHCLFSSTQLVICRALLSVACVCLSSLSFHVITGVLGAGILNGFKAISKFVSVCYNVCCENGSQAPYFSRWVTLANATANACSAENGYWKSSVYALPSIRPNCMTYGSREQQKSTLDQ